MNRLFLLVPVLALIGCDASPTTPAGKSGPTVAARTEPTRTPTRDAATPPAARTTRDEKPPVEKDPPFRRPEIEEPKEDPPEEAPPIPDTFKPFNKDKRTIYFEQKEDGSRRVHLMAEVCLREGPLEVLLCKNNTKEHESILRIDADAREIHFALIAAGAEAGSPVKFVPQYEAAHGTKIKIGLTYRVKGKVKTVPAGEWIKDKKTGKDMAHDWVFAGSRFFKDPERPNAPAYYMANNGELICLANFPDSMLDLPVRSPKDLADLIFEINTARIPPVRTPVIVTLEPVLEKKK